MDLNKRQSNSFFSGTVFPSVSPSKTSNEPKTKEKREADRTDKSLALSKLEELNQV